MSTSERDSILKILLYLIYTLAGLHFLAVSLYLYWTFPWFDLVTHFLGGMWVGLAALWFIYFSGYIPGPAIKIRTAFFVAVGAVLGIGILWEIYEFSADVLLDIPHQRNYMADTALDLVMDTLGAVSGWGIFLGIAREKLPQRQTISEEEVLHT